MDATQALDGMSFILVKTDKNKESLHVFLTEGECVLYRGNSKKQSTHNWVSVARYCIDINHLGVHNDVHRSDTHVYSYGIQMCEIFSVWGLIYK